MLALLVFRCSFHVVTVRMVTTRKNEQQERPVTTLNTPCCAIRTIRVIHTTNTTKAEERVLLHVHARTEGARRTRVLGRARTEWCVLEGTLEGVHVLLGV